MCKWEGLGRLGACVWACVYVSVRGLCDGRRDVYTHMVKAPGCLISYLHMYCCHAMSLLPCAALLTVWIFHWCGVVSVVLGRVEVVDVAATVYAYLHILFGAALGVGGGGGEGRGGYFGELPTRRTIEPKNGVVGVGGREMMAGMVGDWDEEYQPGVCFFFFLSPMIR